MYLFLKRFYEVKVSNIGKLIQIDFGYGDIEIIENWHMKIMFYGMQLYATVYNDSLES